MYELLTTYFCGTKFGALNCNHSIRHSNIMYSFNSRCTFVIAHGHSPQLAIHFFFSAHLHEGPQIQHYIQHLHFACYAYDGNLYSMPSLMFLSLTTFSKLLQITTCTTNRCGNGGEGGENHNFYANIFMCFDDVLASFFTHLNPAHEFQSHLHDNIHLTEASMSSLLSCSFLLKHLDSFPSEMNNNKLSIGSGGSDTLNPKLAVVGWEACVSKHCVFSFGDIDSPCVLSIWSHTSTTTFVHWLCSLANCFLSSSTSSIFFSNNLTFSSIRCKV